MPPFKFASARKVRHTRPKFKTVRQTGDLEIHAASSKRVVLIAFYCFLLLLF